MCGTPFFESNGPLESKQFRVLKGGAMVGNRLFDGPWLRCHHETIALARDWVTRALACALSPPEIVTLPGNIILTRHTKRAADTGKRYVQSVIPDPAR